MTEGTSICIDPAESQTVYLALCGLEADPYRGSVYVSHDGAGSWTEIKEGLPSVIVRPKVRVDEAGSTVWVTTPSNGVGAYRRTQDGREWLPAAEGLPDYWCTALETGNHPGVGPSMFLGQRGGSCFYFHSIGAGLAGPGEHEQYADGQSAGLAIWSSPNPAPGTGTQLYWYLPRPSPTRIDIYDVRGRRVRTLVHAQGVIGRGHVEWDCTDDSGHSVGQGVYYCRIETQSGSAAGKVSVLR